MFNGIGPPELLIVLVIVLVIFGPKRLPGLGRSLGSGMREFKDSITGKGGRRDSDEEDESRQPELEGTAAAASPASVSKYTTSIARPDGSTTRRTYWPLLEGGWLILALRSAARV